MWIARDKNGGLFAYANRPDRICDSYFGVITNIGTRGAEFYLDKDQYPEVTWENSPKELVVKEESV